MSAVTRRSWTSSGARIAAMLVCAGCLTFAFAGHAQPKEDAARALEYATLGKDLATRGKYAMAAKMFREAMALDPDDFNYLYSAARASHLAGDLGWARGCYAGFLDRAPKDHRMRERAQRFLNEIPAATKSGPPAKAPAAAKFPAHEFGPMVDSAHDWKRPWSWVCIVTGALAAGTGTWLAVTGSQAKDELAEDLEKKDDQGLVIGDRDDALERESAANLRLGVGGGLLGVGALAVGAGLWMLATSPGSRRAQWRSRPGGGELLLAWRF